jgi:hypothetical protein
VTLTGSVPVPNSLSSNHLQDYNLC